MRQELGFRSPDSGETDLTCKYSCAWGIAPMHVVVKPYVVTYVKLLTFLPIPVRGHRKNRWEEEPKICDKVGGKNIASGRGTTLWDREKVGRGNF